VCGRSGDCVRAPVWAAGVAAGSGRPRGGLRGGGGSGHPGLSVREGKVNQTHFTGGLVMGFVHLIEEITHKAGTAPYPHSQRCLPMVRIVPNPRIAFWGFRGGELLGRGEGKHIPPRFRTASNPSPGPPWPREGDPGRSSSGACGGGGGARGGGNARIWTLSALRAMYQLSRALDGRPTKLRDVAQPPTTNHFLRARPTPDAAAECAASPNGGISFATSQAAPAGGGADVPSRREIDPCGVTWLRAGHITHPPTVGNPCVGQEKGKERGGGDWNEQRSINAPPPPFKQNPLHMRPVPGSASDSGGVLLDVRPQSPGRWSVRPAVPLRRSSVGRRRTAPATNRPRQPLVGSSDQSTVQAVGGMSLVTTEDRYVDHTKNAKY